MNNKNVKCYRSSATEPKIFIYDGKGTNDPLHVIEKIHSKPVVFIKVNLYLFK